MDSEGRKAYKTNRLAKQHLTSEDMAEFIDSSYIKIADS